MPCSRAPLPATKTPPNFSPRQGLNQDPTTSPTNGAAKINTFNEPKYYKPIGGAITHVIVKHAADILRYMRENSSLHIVRVLEKSCFAITDSYWLLVLARRASRRSSNIAILKLERQILDFIAEV